MKQVILDPIFEVAYLGHQNPHFDMYYCFSTLSIKLFVLNRNTYMRKEKLAFNCVVYIERINTFNHILSSFKIDQPLQQL